MPFKNHQISIFLFIQKHKYEFLLFALVQHLFIGIFITDLPSYTQIIWPINMVILGLASVGLFFEKGKLKNRIRNILLLMVVLFPIFLPLFGKNEGYMFALNLIFSGFFIFIFWELLKFLLKPSYINADVISASACGYLLLIEINTFLFQLCSYGHPDSFKGLSTADPASTYMDFVYFCSITITSIGFGDITPNTHHTKLITSLFGIIGQFYTVVLVGIIISKFSSKPAQT
ncbi:potassium channel family protein [Pedobacter caeni]|uniref:Ion channel n=1 Tax=Pedobacter caeni TaxID=288992 RepID=A0A1M5JUN8_9SPHI|nr:potassium channel family protein [Pedobacter caeni]SHG44287.1 Ion channel [Pedobacter caeni]